MPAAPRSGVEALQRAVVAALKASEAVQAELQGRVFDEVPSDKDKPKAPYLYLGPVNRRMLEMGTCGDAKSVRFRIFVVSTEFGRLQAWAALEAAIGALNNKELALDAPFSTSGDLVRFVQDGDVIDPINPKSAFADFSINTLIRMGDQTDD